MSARRPPPNVLFVCVHNAGRSQMAAGLLEKHAGSGVIVRSSGTTPSTEIHPTVIEAMLEVGIDLSHEAPKVLTVDAVEDADVVITMGCGDACPVVPATRYLDWDVPDPAGLPLEAVRAIRDQIDHLTRGLASELLEDRSRALPRR